MDYKNPFHSSDYQDSTHIIRNDNDPILYGGYMIFHRVEVHRKFTDNIKSVFVADVYDVVKNDVCVTMRAGMNGAKKWIDQKNEKTNAN